MSRFRLGDVGAGEGRVGDDEAPAIEADLSEAESLNDVLLELN